MEPLSLSIDEDILPNLKSFGLKSVCQHICSRTALQKSKVHTRFSQATLHSRKRDERWSEYSL